MSGKINEVLKTDFNFDNASGEDSLTENINKKIKQHKDAQLAELPGGLINLVMQQKDENSLTSGGQLSVENNDHQPTSYSNKNFEQFFSSSTAHTGLLDNNKTKRFQSATDIVNQKLPDKMAAKAVNNTKSADLLVGNGVNKTKSADLFTGNDVNKVKAADLFAGNGLNNIKPADARMESSINNSATTHLVAESERGRSDINRTLPTGTALSESAILTRVADKEKPSQVPLAERKSSLFQDSDALMQQQQGGLLKREAVNEGQPGNAAEHSRSNPAAMLQSKMRAQAAESPTSSRSLDLDYKFQQWSGQHSVKVSVSGEAVRDGNMTLLPSGTRAADALTSQFAQLTSHTPKLLEPRRDGDEQKQRQQEHAQDEEQE
ncbi:hypothetical protein [Erwinia mallotivora]|uniref:Surface presentation of antigen domain-containing protein n=1 Tax=Erwinia mallotivora TaxID=69222 RepID=A0A014NB21_9GAMM|nr:hypothetical protein [Erwinia mallotivora]EXU76593.1 hypothetical protein BG55_04620 [Erwinia mallotivora]